MARDEYAQIYNHYQVLASKFRLDFTTSGSVPMIVGFSIRKNTTVSTVAKYIEMGEGNYIVLGNDDSNRASRTLTGYVNIANAIGSVASNDTMEADIGGNPSEELYLHIFAAANDTSLDPAAMDTAIQIDYDTKFREKKLLAQS